MSTTPGDGATVLAPPAVVTVMFDQEMSSRSARVAVVDSSDQEHHVGAPAVEGRRVVQDVGHLPPGTYTVSFQLVAADGDAVADDFTFTVAGTQVPSVPATDHAADPSDAADHAADDNVLEGDAFGRRGNVVVQNDDASGWVFVGFGMALAVGASAALWFAARERRHGSGGNQPAAQDSRREAD